MLLRPPVFIFFFFNDTATTEIYTLSLHDALPIVLTFAHEHPLLDRLLEADQQAFLPYVTTRSLPMIVSARETMLKLLMERAPGADEQFIRTVVDGTTRAIVSYMLTPSDRSTDEIVHAISALIGAAL